LKSTAGASRNCYFGREWKQLEATHRQLQASEEQYRLLFRDNPLPMWVVEEGTLAFLAVNDAAVEHYGYSQKEFRAMTIRDIRPREDGPALLEMSSAPKGGRIQNAGILRHRKKDGTIIHAGVVWRPLTFESRLARLVLAKDVTEQKLASEQLRVSAEQLHELAGRLHLVREEERTRIARELHDQLGQTLTAIKLDISWVAGKLPQGETRLTEKIQSVLDVADSTIALVRKIAAELRPLALDLGLLSAIEWQAQEFQARTGMECELKLPQQDVALDENRLSAVFRILQEALTNVARHSGASRTCILLEKHPRDLILEVRDNGRGLLADPMSCESLGLMGMRERALFVGGELSFHSNPGEGTVVRARIPFTLE